LLPCSGESATLDSQVLVLATELWLLYLQPWTARPICNGTTGVLPTRSNNLGAYSSEWRPYVAANLHFYTTLLACYMRYTHRAFILFEWFLTLIVFS